MIGETSVSTHGMGDSRIEDSGVCLQPHLTRMGYDLDGGAQFFAEGGTSLAVKCIPIPTFG